jgi:hypothetical protein
MAFEHKPGTGTMFVNTPRPGETLHPRAPKLKGRGVLPDGTKIEVSMWPATDRVTGEKRTDSSGHPFWSMKFSLEQGEYHRGTPPVDDVDEGLPL